MYAVGLKKAFEAYGLRVIEVPKWQTRGHGGLVAVSGIVDHHTGGPATGNYPSRNTVVNGRPGLAGPLGNVGLARDGTVLLIAAGKCWHAGAGSWRNLQGNADTLGIEAESTGRGDWTPSQVTNYPKANAALADFYGIQVGNIIGHYEWAPKRKIDPFGWPGGMAGMRRSVTAEIAKHAAKLKIERDRTKRAARTKARLARKLVVDGKFGPATVKALRKALGRPAGTAFDARTKGALQGWLGVKPDGVIGPVTVKALQRRLGASQDGVWGKETTKALQRALNAGKVKR
jgi:hypothetical protein